MTNDSPPVTTSLQIPRLFTEFIQGYFLRVLQLPLIAFYVLPLVFIATALPPSVSRLLVHALFINAKSGQGTLKITNTSQLAAAVGIWLFVIQIAAMPLKSWGKKRPNRLSTKWIAFGSLTILWIVAIPALLLQPHQGSTGEYLGIGLFLYLFGLSLLFSYQIAGSKFQNLVPTNFTFGGQSVPFTIVPTQSPTPPASPIQPTEPTSPVTERPSENLPQ